MLAVYDFAQRVLIPVQLVLAMLGMGLTMTVKDFASIARNPSGVALGLAIQLGFVPLLALGFVHGFGLTKGWAVGLLLIAVAPVGAWSNLLTFLGKGNTPLAIAVTAASTTGSIVTIPLLLALTAEAYLPPGFSLPAKRIVLEIIGYLLAPLAAGMALQRAFPTDAGKSSKWCIRGSLALVVFITVAALGSGRMSIAAYGWRPPLVLLAFGVVATHAVPLLVRALRIHDYDSVALSIGVAIRNMGVALLLVHNFFPNEEAGGHVLYSCLFYAGMAFFLGVAPALRHARGKSVALFLRPFPKPGVTPG